MTQDSYNSFAYGSNLRDYIAGLLLALLFHVCLLTIMVGLWKGNPTRARPMFPYGESSLAMTFVVPPSAGAVTMQSQEAPPVAAPFFTEPEVEEEEAPASVAIPDPPAQPRESQPAPQSDADEFSKGIQGLPRMSAGVRPVYPLGARHRGEQGNVTVRVQVNTDGQVKWVAIAMSSGHLELDQAALKALRRACFVPARRNGKPVASESLIVFRFQLVN
ncbi:MAG: energy transducer TonB [Verrucomicrobiota bacterium]